MSRSRTLSAVEGVLRAAGYTPNNIVADARSASLVGSDGGNRLDMVAYGRPFGPFDASTATIIVEIAEGDSRRHIEREQMLADEALLLSVPVVIIARSSGWRLYAVDPGGGLSLVRELSWSEDLGALRVLLDPVALLNAKLGSRQLSLFPLAATVSARGRKRREQALAPRVRAALDATTSLPSGPLMTTTADHARAARLVIGALTAVVLRDKEVNGNRRSGSAQMNSDILINRALTHHPQQFGWLSSASTQERELLERIVDQFADIDFSNIEPALLSELYENLIVDDALKREIGAHYTPPGLARRVLSWLPVEEIAPEDRRAYDPTCGSGSFLIAAHDRIRDLQSPALGITESHEDLVTRIRGGDVDPVAAGIANLALFLNAMPAGNGWQIDVADVFTVPQSAPAPTILVANPPWNYSNTGTQDDEATKVLRRLLDWTPPGGLLGVVLPVGWLSRKSVAARASRERLFQTHEVLEIWRLPQGTFASADLGAAVVLARRPRTGQIGAVTSIRRRISTADQLPKFYEVGKSDAIMAANLGPNDLATGPLRTWWSGRDISRTETIASYAYILTGPQPESPTVLAARGAGTQPNTAFVSWREVAEYGDVHSATATPAAFPEDMQAGSRRGAEMIGRPKVFIPTGKNPERPWRIKVGIDPVGDRLPKNTARAVLPRGRSDRQPPPHQVDPDTILYGLFAYLGSGFVSAWLDESVATRNLPPSMIEDMPAPDIETLHDLAIIGRRILDHPRKVDLIAEIERRVWKWVDAPDQLRAHIIRRMNSTEAPEGGFRYPESSHASIEEQTRNSAEAPALERAGAVLSVGSHQVLVAIPGRTPDAGRQISLPARMPAALLRKGAAFVVVDDGQPLSELTYRFDELSYLDDDQVLEELEATCLPSTPREP